MADFPPLRIEPLIDPATGLLTLRAAEYLESLTSSVNQNIISTEGIEGLFSEIQQIQAFSGAITKAIQENDRLTIALSQAQAIQSLQAKQIAELDRAVDQLGRAESLIAKLTKQIKELEALANDY